MGGCTCLRSLGQVEMTLEPAAPTPSPSAATLALCGTQDPYAGCRLRVCLSLRELYISCPKSGHRECVCACDEVQKKNSKCGKSVCVGGGGAARVLEFIF